MSQPKVRYRTYQDRRGNSVRIKQTQDREGRWIETWSVAQMMQVDFSRYDDEPDTQEQAVLVYRTASDSSQGSQPPTGSPNHGRTTKNTNRKDSV